MIVDWHYRADENYPSTKIIRDAGFNYLVSPSAWNFTSTFPVNINSLPNIKYIVKSGLENESSGMINSNWGDYGAETFKEFILYNYAWSAQCSWDFAQSDLNKFNNDYFYDYFGINDDRLPNIYKTLSDPLNQIVWHEVWRHPSLNFRESPWWEPKLSKAVRITWNEMTLPQLSRDIEILKSKVRKNSDHLELVEFIIKLNEWYRLKLETQFELLKFVKENEENSLNDLSILTEKNVVLLGSLRDNYRKLWLKYYKEANLLMIEDKFNRLIAYFNEIKSEIAKKHRKLNPLIESKWLYLKSSDSTYESKAEFMTTFEINGMPSEALLQLMGDTYVQLYINGKFVERVYARRSLSLLIDYKRIKFFDIKSFLMKGKNTITLIAENFSKKSGAGFNLFASIKFGKSEIIIKSDDSGDSELKWTGRRISDDTWRETVSKPYPFEVIAPNFNTKRTSWIER